MLTKKSSNPKFDNCNIERTIIGDNSQYYEHYTDNSQHTHISENYSTFEGRKENENIIWNIFTAFIEKLAPFFISRFGETKTTILGFSISILGVLFCSYPVLFNDNNLSIILDNTGQKFEFTFVFGYALVIIAVIILSIGLISDHTKCKKCNKGFGYKEIKRPLIEETRCSKGIIQKTTRYYKCQYCGDEKIVSSKRIIKYKDLLK